MGLKRTTQPNVEPLTLADALAHLREDAGAADAYITSLITVARQACENKINRTLITSTWTLVLDAFPDAFELLHAPIIGVTSVKYYDTNGVQQTLSASDYIVDTANSEIGYVVPAYNKAWPDTQARINAVEVVYTAGYGPAAADVPTPLVHWIRLAVSDMYSRRNLTSDKPAVAQDFAAGLLDAYKVWVI